MLIYDSLGIGILNGICSEVLSLGTRLMLLPLGRTH